MCIITELGESDVSECLNAINRKLLKSSSDTEE